VNRQANRNAGGGAAGGGNSAGARGAILLALAAVLGIVLLQAFDTDGSGVGVEAGGTPSPTSSPGSGSTGNGSGSTVPTIPTSTTTPGRTPAEVTVLVANGTGIKGLGSQTADSLKVLGYTTLAAVDATKALDTTTVQHAEGYQTEARAIALTLGLQTTAVLPLNSPAVPDAQGANIFVLLGAEAARTSTTTTSTTTG